MLITTASEASAVLAPIFMMQGAYVRKRTPKLPCAAGANVGLTSGDGAPLRLLFVGESTVTGVGAPTYEEALVGRTADCLAQLTQRRIHWQAWGKRGITADKATAYLLPQIPPEPVDLAVVAIGVNDVLHFHRPARFQRDLVRLIHGLRQRIGVSQLLLTAIPNVGRFPSLPQPLRTGLGLRAHAFNVTARRLSRHLPSVTHVTTHFQGGVELLGADGFHPSPLAYQQWGRHLAHVAYEQLTQRSNAATAGKQ